MLLTVWQCIFLTTNQHIIQLAMTYSV